MQERRLGKFYVTEDFVKYGDVWPILKALEFIPWHVESRSYMPDFEYIGYSPLFEVCELGAMIPTYNMEISRDKDGVIGVEVKIVESTTTGRTGGL